MAKIEVASVAVGFSGRSHSYEVLIDGQARGNLKSGETQAFFVHPGVHTVRLAMQRNSPPPIKVVVFGTTSLLCHTKDRTIFGLFPTGAAETQIVVREEQDVTPAAADMAWCDPACRADAAPVHDLLAAD